jgi:SAM-dependent methyltransferase
MLAYDPLGSLPAPTAAGPVGSPAYQRFYAEVAAAQLRDWLPGDTCRLLDLSGGGGLFGLVAAEAGHQVVHVVEPGSAVPGPFGGMSLVQADPTELSWVAAAQFDAVLAEGRALSHCLATESAMDDVARVLRPGGRLLLCVDSLLAGMARLADQQRWAELADVPLADVVLVPGPDGSITRCFWPEELRSVLTDAGLEVEWVRPRTVLSADAVERTLAADPGQLGRLVRAETTLAREREGDAHGVHLVASARRPDPTR